LGGELEEGEPQTKTRACEKTYTERFYEAFPWYLAMGMTYDQFWNEDCNLAKCYKEAYKIQRDRKNQELWIQGLYFCKAINGSVIGEYFKINQSYPGEPLDLYDVKKEDPDKDKKQMLSIKERMLAVMPGINKKFEN